MAKLINDLYTFVQDQISMGIKFFRSDNASDSVNTFTTDFC